MAQQFLKGERAEECMRMHFLASGAFVVRGVKFLQSEEEVTDIDIWAYFRSSEFSRSIIVADVKNKKKARAFERVLWVKGMQVATQAHTAIIATAENRLDVVEFADKLSVQVIGGAALQRLMSESPLKGRLTQEEFVAEIDVGRNGGKQGAPSTRVERAVARLANGLNFRTLNNWLDDASAAVRWSVDHPAHASAALRCSYYLISLVALGADHLSSAAPFETVQDKQNRILRGLTYGSANKEESNKLIAFAEAAAKQYADPTGAASAAIRKGVEGALASLPFAAMAEYVAKTAAAGDLFRSAIELEAAAFATDLLPPSELRPSSKILLGVLADVAEVPRQKLFALKPSSTAIRAPPKDLFDNKS